jgi:hypothetical protein
VYSPSKYSQQQNLHPLCLRDPEVVKAGYPTKHCDPKSLIDFGRILPGEHESRDSSSYADLVLVALTTQSSSSIECYYYSGQSSCRPVPSPVFILVSALDSDDLQARRPTVPKPSRPLSTSASAGDGTSLSFASRVRRVTSISQG